MARKEEDPGEMVVTCPGESGGRKFCRNETTCVLGLEPMGVCAPLSVRVLSTLFVCGAL